MIDGLMVMMLAVTMITVAIVLTTVGLMFWYPTAFVFGVVLYFWLR